MAMRQPQHIGRLDFWPCRRPRSSRTHLASLTYNARAPAKCRHLEPAPPFQPEHVITCNEHAHPMSCTHPPGPRGLRGASWRCRAVLQSTIVPRSPHSAPSAEAPIWPQIQLCATRTFVPGPWRLAIQTIHFGPPTGPAERLRGPPACREASRPASTPRLSANGGFRIIGLEAKDRLTARTCRPIQTPPPAS